MNEKENLKLILKIILEKPELRNKLLNTFIECSNENPDFAVKVFKKFFDNLDDYHTHLIKMYINREKDPKTLRMKKDG